MQGTNAAMQNAKNSLGQVDLIVEAAGIPKLDFELMNLLGTDGVCVLTGVPEEGPPLSVEGGKITRQLVLKNQILFGSVNAGHAHFKQAVMDLEDARTKWPGIIEQLITSKTHYTHFADVLTQRKPDEIKAVIEWSA